MRRQKNDPLKIVLCAAVLLLLCILVAFTVRFIEMRDQLAIAPTPESLRELESQKTELADTLAEKENTLAALKEQIATAEAEILRLQEKEALENTDQTILVSQITSQTEQIAVLRKQASALETEVKTYRDQLEKLQKAVAVDWEYRSDLLSDLYILLAQGAPLLEPGKVFETKETETPETETADPAEETFLSKEEWEAAYPKIALYYEDLTTGYHVTYNEDTVMYSASLIKAPYVYSVVREITEFEEKKRNFSADGAPLYDENGYPLFEGMHPNLDENGNIVYLEGEEKYDLSRIWTYDPKTMKVDGSGRIQYEAEGFTLTWREVFEYALLYSDNIAFAQIREAYGMSSFYTLSWQLSFSGTQYGFMQLSAADCASFLRELYDFFAAETQYAQWMQDLMCRSAHTVMIPYAVSPAKAAHKYGWDRGAYHDMAIVYDENPYILVIMTTLENGGTEIDTYIRSLVQQCKLIHADVQKERDALEESMKESETEPNT